MGTRNERVKRATAIRDLALRFIQEKGRWRKSAKGPEVQAYEDEQVSIVFYVRPPEPQELLHFGLYSLELWCKGGVGKVLNLCWDSAGDEPRIVSFRRGEWEDGFLSRGQSL